MHSFEHCIIINQHEYLFAPIWLRVTLSAATCYYYLTQYLGAILATVTIISVTIISAFTRVVLLSFKSRFLQSPPPPVPEENYHALLKLGFS